MKNFCIAHFCTWIGNLPVLSFLLFAGLAANIKCSLLLKWKNQQQIPRSNPDTECWVTSCPSDRSSPNACYHIQSIRFFSFCIRGYQEFISTVSTRWTSAPQNSVPVIDCRTPIYTHAINVNTSAQLTKQIWVLFIYINISNISSFIFFNQLS